MVLENNWYVSILYDKKQLKNTYGKIAKTIKLRKVNRKEKYCISSKSYDVLKSQSFKLNTNTNHHNITKYVENCLN